MFEHLFAERGLSLDRLKTLIEVAKAGSIAAAARGDSARQSLYSRQIKELEEFFGVELASGGCRGFSRWRTSATVRFPLSSRIWI